MNLREAAQQALDALELGCTDHDGNPVDLVGPAITALRAALAEATINKMETVEPVAYVTGFSKGYATVQPVDPCLLMCVGMALYRSPPKRKRLTDEEIRRIDDATPFHEGADWAVRFARAIERAPGIGGKE